MRIVQEVATNVPEMLFQIFFPYQLPSAKPVSLSLLLDCSHSNGISPQENPSPLTAMGSLYRKILLLSTLEKSPSLSLSPASPPKSSPAKIQCSRIPSSWPAAPPCSSLPSQKLSPRKMTNPLQEAHCLSTLLSFLSATEKKPLSSFSLFFFFSFSLLSSP